MKILNTTLFTTLSIFKKNSILKFAFCLLLFAFCLFMYSCKSKSTETKNAITKEETHTATETELTDEQIKAIGLQTGSIEQRNLKSTLKVNGKLMLQYVLLLL